MIKRPQIVSKPKSKTRSVGNGTAQATDDYESRTGYWTNAAIAERKAAKAAKAAAAEAEAEAALLERKKGVFAQCRGALCGSRRAKGGRRTRNRRKTRR